MLFLSRVGWLVLVFGVLPGCTVLAVADTVGSVAVSTVGLAADAAIGTVRIAGKVVGAAADAALPDKPAAP